MHCCHLILFFELIELTSISQRDFIRVSFHCTIFLWFHIIYNHWPVSFIENNKQKNYIHNKVLKKKQIFFPRFNIFVCRRNVSFYSFRSVWQERSLQVIRRPACFPSQFIVRVLYDFILFHRIYLIGRAISTRFTVTS